MSSIKLADLVQKLYMRTVTSSIQWEETSKQGIFQTSFKNYSVQIFSNFDHDTEQTDYYIRVVNDAGEFVDQVSDIQLKGYLDNSFKIMEELYLQARRNALGADKAIESIIDELDNDIPF